MGTLDELERGIVAALQVDGRASWRTIANVLGEHERTVARRGNALLESGVVSVTGLRVSGGAVVLRGQCSMGAARLAVEALAQRQDSSFAYLVTGVSDVVAEILLTSERLEAVVSTELPAVPGMARLETFPVLKYFQTIRQWRLGALSPEQRRQLGDTDHEQGIRLGATARMEHPGDEAVAACLTQDGRMPIERIARTAGLSETTARRRVEALLSAQVVHLRTLVEPADVGLPLEALLWIKVPPARLDEAGRAFAAHPRVRYAAAIAGTFQLVVDATLRTMDEFYAFLTRPEWAPLIGEVAVTMVVAARKRGGRIRPPVG